MQFFCGELCTFAGYVEEMSRLPSVARHDREQRETRHEQRETRHDRKQRETRHDREAARVKTERATRHDRTRENIKRQRSCFEMVTEFNHMGFSRQFRLWKKEHGDGHVTDEKGENGRKGL